VTDRHPKAAAKTSVEALPPLDAPGTRHRPSYFSPHRPPASDRYADLSTYSRASQTIVQDIPRLVYKGDWARIR